MKTNILISIGVVECVQVKNVRNGKSLSLTTSVKIVLNLVHNYPVQFAFINAQMKRSRYIDLQGNCITTVSSEKQLQLSLIITVFKIFFYLVCRQLGIRT